MSASLFQPPQPDVQLHDTIRQIVDQFGRVMANIERVIVGKTDVIRKVLTTLTSGGHVLLLDVPGVGKTVLARAIAATVQGRFKRIQFTPDLLPMDITGTNVFNMRKKAFEFQAGPVFTNILLADEINRATPKTQAALLEVMAEGQVTVEGTTHTMPPPFLVIATMNPLEHDGTYPLPAAQLDRFSMRLSMGYPPAEAELRMLDIHLGHNSALSGLEPVMTTEDFLRWQQTIPYIYASPALKRYVVDLVTAMRNDTNCLQSVSPRATLMLMRTAMSAAMLQGRDHVTPNDIHLMAPHVLAHRLVISGNRAPLRYAQDTLGQVPIPN
ncbi:MAG: MoxR family ATPase [Myxococcota bacterium]